MWGFNSPLAHQGDLARALHAVRLGPFSFPADSGETSLAAEVAREMHDSLTIQVRESLSKLGVTRSRWSRRCPHDSRVPTFLRTAPLVPHHSWHVDFDSGDRRTMRGGPRIQRTCFVPGGHFVATIVLIFFPFLQVTVFGFPAYGMVGAPMVRVALSTFPNWPGALPPVA